MLNTDPTEATLPTDPIDASDATEAAESRLATARKESAAKRLCTERADMRLHHEYAPKIERREVPATNRRPWRSSHRSGSFSLTTRTSMSGCALDGSDLDARRGSGGERKIPRVDAGIPDLFLLRMSFFLASV